MIKFDHSKPMVFDAMGLTVQKAQEISDCAWAYLRANEGESWSVIMEYIINDMNLQTHEEFLALGFTLGIAEGYERYKNLNEVGDEELNQ